MATDPVLTSAALARLTEINWRAVKNLKRVLYNYDDGMIMVLPAEPLLVCRSASGAEVFEGGRREVRPTYREKVAHCGMFMDYAQLVWRRYLLARTDSTADPNAGGAECVDPAG